jgi:hypothetical protein
MRYLALVAFALPLLALPGALADEPPAETVSEQLTALQYRKAHYEEMLRDARTETAAQYFLDQLRRIEHERRVLEQSSDDAVDEQALLPPTALIQRADLWLRTRILEKLEKDGPTITDVVSWTRRELPEEFLLWLAKWLGGDEPLSIDAAREAWQKRSKNAWLDASYGSGSFIVRPPTVKEPPRTRAMRGGDGGVRIPKPPTRDQWWKDASTTQRTSWVMAYVVERCELFEVGAQASRPCPVCKGEGLIHKTLQTGEPLSYLCTRCGGARQDHIVRYR